MYKNIVTQTLRKPLLKTWGISVDVLRLDLLHPDISGNKWFKLKYHIEDAIKSGKKGIATFGGPYSNHLVATAVACHDHHLLSTGIIRGEKILPENQSIRQMQDAGMNLVYVSREEYSNKDRLSKKFISENSEYYFIPEGGQSTEGIKGAADILDYAGKDYTHIICSVGTGTTLTGLVEASAPSQQIIGIPAIKISDQESNEITDFISTNTSRKNFILKYGYEFGGYAKKTPELLSFMNTLFEEENLPSDFVYTGKMFYGVNDMLLKKAFPSGSKLLLIHTGGLQGNRSLPEGSLVF